MNFTNEPVFVGGSPMRTLIDCGHGGIVGGRYVTNGKQYDHGDFVFYEGVFNRQLGLKIAEELKRNFINYEFIVRTNNDVSLTTRVRRANSIQHTHDSIYLSIHGNAAGTSSAKGIEIFTSPGETDSDVLATCIYDELETMEWKMRGDYSDGDADKESRFYVLRKTAMPAVLIEYGFFTNREEALLLLDEEVQRELARLTVNGIKKYLT